MREKESERERERERERGQWTLGSQTYRDMYGEKERQTDRDRRKSKQKDKRQRTVPRKTTQKYEKLAEICSTA